MRFLIIVKATAESEAGTLPDPALINDMAVFHEELAKAGALLDAAGLKPTAQGWRVRFDGEGRHVIDGPFTESKELIAGYTLIQARSREEAMEWSRRYPNPRGRGLPCEIEVRPLYSLEDFPPSEGVERFRAMEAQS